MQGSSYIAVLAASALAAAFVIAPHCGMARAQSAKTFAAARPSAVGRATKPAPVRSLAQMDLTPRDYLVRPYAPAYQAGNDQRPIAVDYRFAGDGVMSFGLHRGSGAPSDTSGVNQSFASSSPTTHSSVGALVVYSLP